jgi:hypothetical protein
MNYISVFVLDARIVVSILEYLDKSLTMEVGDASNRSNVPPKGFQ